MITVEKFIQIEEKGLTLDLYFLLCSIHSGEKPPETRRNEGYINLLVKKGYVKNGELTEEAVELVKDEMIIKAANQPVEEIVEKEPFDVWVKRLHKICEDEMIRLTGKKQMRQSINGGNPHSFMCRAEDMKERLLTVVKRYKLLETDRGKVEQVMINHINSCHKANNWFPTIWNYIYKDKMSKLATDLSTLEDDKKPTKAKTAGSDVIESKKLFG